MAADTPIAPPEFLYHYTSIESLALILNGNRFRFGRLDLTDDMIEGTAADILNVGKFSFVSCWTEDPEESIPFWNMYTPQMRGVRIGLPAFPFAYHNSHGETVPHGTASKGESIIPFELDSLGQEKDNLAAMQFVPENFLFPVSYRPMAEVQSQTFFVPDIKEIAISPGRIGRIKNDHWMFQREWRYMLRFLPVRFMQPQPEESTDIRDYLQSVLNETPVTVESLYVTLSNDAVRQLQITLGPRCTEAQELIVKALLEARRLHTEPSRSALSGKIR